MNRARLIQGSSCLLAGAAVVLGAFGAHAREGRITPEAIGWYETGANYHFSHALGWWLAGDAVRTGRRGGIPALFLT